MRNTRYLIVVLFLFFGHMAQSQNLQCDSASMQNINGGIPGSFGTEYYFKITSKVKPAKLKMDSVWVNNARYPDTKVKLTARHISVSRAEGVTSWRIKIGFSSGGMPRQPVPSAVPDMKGVAMVYYTYKGKHKVFTVKSVIHAPTINAP